MIWILIGTPAFWVCLTLEAEAESESASRRRTFLRGDADPSSMESPTVACKADNPLDVCGSESKLNKSDIFDNDEEAKI